MIGKPYSGKLNVWFDEGELEIGHLLLRQFSTLPFYTFFIKGALFLFYLRDKVSDGKKHATPCDRVKSFLS